MKKSTPIPSIFKNRNPDLVKLFEQAGHPRKVMCVSLDYAKQTHTVLIANGEGQGLKEILDVRNTPAGVAFLHGNVDRLCKKHGIDKKHVCFGGEDCGWFSNNFIHALNVAGHLVVGFNAKDAKSQRESYQASTDKLDLLGILKMILDKRGVTRPAAGGDRPILQKLTRHRNGLTISQTSEDNRIHDLVDQLFPGFLDEKQSGIPPFSETSLRLMEDRFSARRMAKRNRGALIRKLKAAGLQRAEEKAARLQTYAASALGGDPLLAGALQSALGHEVRLVRTLSDCISQSEKEIALRLASCPGALLTSIRGTGIVLAAGVCSELSDDALSKAIRRSVSYAGIVPRTEQTGGPDKPAVQVRVSRRCNHRLKNMVVQCANHLGQHGPDDLRQDHARRAANGQHADFGMARRYLRMAVHLMRTGECYKPKALRDSLGIEALRAYYLEMWPSLRAKWKRAGALEVAFHRDNPLGQWRECVEAVYQIQLPLA
jgi:transposase